MTKTSIANLQDCSKFRQTLLAKPPFIVHGTLVLLVVFLVSALLWVSVTHVNLVVRAPGRIRPASQLYQVFVPESVESPGYSEGRLVQEVLYREGDIVSKDQILIRLDTHLLEQTAAKLKLTIQGLQSELAGLDARLKLLNQQWQSARAKAETELLKSQEDLRQAKEAKTIRERQAATEYRHAQIRLERLKNLREENAVSDFTVDEAELKVHETKANLELARQPLSARTVDIKRRDLKLIEDSYALQRKELEILRARHEADLRKAKEEKSAIERQRARAVLRSPSAGVVTSKEVKAGDVLQRGTPVVEIAHHGQIQFEAVVSTRQATNLREGMPVRVALDAYDQQWYGTLPGKVVFVSPDSRPARNQMSTSDAAMSGYEIRIELDRYELRRGELHGRARLGLTGTAEIIINRQSILSVLRRNIHRSISFG